VTAKHSSPTAEVVGRKKPNLVGFRTLAGVFVGLAAGVGITILHSVRAAPSPALIAPVTAHPQPRLADPTASMLGPTLVEQLAQQRRLHRDAIERHQREVRDSNWAVSMEKIIGELLAPLASAGKFKVSSIDCRTKSCVVIVRVATYMDAQQAWPPIVRARGDFQCSTEVTLPEAQPDTTPFDFSVIYDCSVSRPSP